MSRLIQSENKMHRYLVFIILAVVLNVDYLELDEYDLASPASVEASGTIELKEMESVIGELFEMSGVSRGEGETRAVRLDQQLAAAFSHLLISWFWSRFVFWFWSWSFLQSGLCSIFGKLDINGDEELDEVEFIGGCLDDSELVRLLNGSKVYIFMPIRLL